MTPDQALAPIKARLEAATQSPEVMGTQQMNDDHARLLAAVEAVEKHLGRMDLNGHALTCSTDLHKRAEGARIRRDAKKIRAALSEALGGDGQ